MTQIHRLRLAFERRYPIVAGRYQATPPPMQPFLALPIEERLVLLALADGADEATIRAILPFAKQTDARLTSKRMLAAVERLKAALESPLFFIDLGEVPLDTQVGDLTKPTTKVLCPDHLIPQDIERTFRQIWYPSAAPLLLGAMVPIELKDLSLKERLILYLLIVQESTYEEVQELLGCSDWSIRQAIKKAMKELTTHA